MEVDVFAAGDSAARRPARRSCHVLLLRLVEAVGAYAQAP
jgi:hypothetical protein